MPASTPPAGPRLGGLAEGPEPPRRALLAPRRGRQDRAGRGRGGADAHGDRPGGLDVTGGEGDDRRAARPGRGAAAGHPTREGGVMGREGFELEIPIAAGASIALAYVPPGEFLMGSGNILFGEAPAHPVRIRSGFHLSRCPVTRAQWRAIMGDDPSTAGSDPDCPVDGVSWDRAGEFCRRLGEVAGRPARLPTEAEWEYACRGRLVGRVLLRGVGAVRGRLGGPLGCEAVVVRVWLVQPQQRRRDQAGRATPAEPLGAARRARQHLGMVRRRLARRLWRGPCRRERQGGGWGSGVAAMPPRRGVGHERLPVPVDLPEPRRPVAGDQPIRPPGGGGRLTSPKDHAGGRAEVEARRRRAGRSEPALTNANFSSTVTFAP